MSDYRKYQDFFDSYDNSSNRQESYTHNGKRKPQTKRKRRKRLVRRLFSFLVIVIILGIIAGVIANCSNSQRGEGNYTTLSTNQNGNSSDTESLSQGTISRPASTDKTVNLGSKIESKFAILVDCSTNTVLAQKSPDTKIYPASLTKIMTLLVAAENVDSINSAFTMTQEIIDPIYKQGATMAGFCAGEEVKLQDMFYGSVLESGAEASVGLAIYVAESEENFVALMNKKAKELGLKNTNFTNVSGLHDKNHYTTCREMAIIMRAVLNNDFCRKVISTEYYTVAKNEFHDELQFHSGMFSRMHGTEPEVATVKGGKTGYTMNSGNCLVSYAETDDKREIICVTADGGGKYVPIYDCIELYKKYSH